MTDITKTMEKMQEAMEIKAQQKERLEIMKKKTHITKLEKAIKAGELETHKES